MKFNFGLLPALTLFGSLSVITAKVPILIVPGLTGSQLWGTVNRRLSICKTAKPKLLWFGWRTYTMLCPSLLELQYNQSTNTYSDKQGVNVSVPGFGETRSVECVGDDVTCTVCSRLQYLKDFVDYFVARGYQRGVTIRAAPYDWRLAADSLKSRGYFDKLRELAEEMYNKNGTPVALVVHSMGASMSLYFLNKVVNQTWKNQYIKAYIPLSGAFAGFSQTVEDLVSGFTPHALAGFQIPFLKIERSLESIYWLMPRDEIFGDQVLVETPDANYTAKDYQPMFKTFIKYPLGWSKYNATSTINAGYKYPGVPTYCFYGSNLSTPLTFMYSSDDPRKEPKIMNGSGDGFVNKESLEVCLRWANSTNSTGFQSRAFPGVKHNDMVKNTKVLDAIAEIVKAGPPSGSVIPRVDIYSTRVGSPSSSVIARVDIYSTMFLLASAFIIRAVM